jgi:hypothetical protein
MSTLEIDQPSPSAHTHAGAETAPLTTGSPRWQRRSLFLGGIVFAVGNLLHPLEHTDAAYESATWEAAHLLIFFSIPMLVLGLPVLHRRLRDRVAPRIATIAVASSVAGLIGIAPGTVIEAFVAPTIGHEAMVELESGGMLAVNALLGTAFLGGTMALGWAVRKARLEPRWAGPVLLASAGVMFLVMGATGPVAGVVIITATMAYGGALAALARTAS